MTTDRLTPAVGRDALEFIDDAWPDRPLVVHTYRPEAHAPGDPVVLVQHGINRNGDDYRDFWIEPAERHRLLVAATTFPPAHFPGPANYNNGAVLDDTEKPAPRARWLYGIPGRVFAALRAAGVTTRTRARLFGHSAGGQFVHRRMALESHEGLEAVIAANAGWYMLPTLEQPFPEGLGGLGLTVDALARWFAYPMVILAGEADTDENSPNLPKEPAALAQGPNRLARARYFHAVGREEAARRGLPFAWRLLTVPGVGHDGGAMSAAAAAIWFEGRQAP